MLKDLKLHKDDLQQHCESSTNVLNQMLDRLIRTVDGPIVTSAKGTNYTREQSLGLFLDTLKECPYA